MLDVYEEKIDLISINNMSDFGRILYQKIYDRYISQILVYSS